MTYTPKNSPIQKIGLDRKARIKSIISKYLAVPAKWTRHAREHLLTLFTRRVGYTDIFRIEFG